MGRRVLADAQHETLEGVDKVESLETYQIRRVLRGVPEGQKEILHGSALLQESNIDFMGGVDFRKGCYVGQELTIRTHHTGVVRKRILPVQLYPLDSSPPEKLTYDAKLASNNALPPPETKIFRQGDEKKKHSTGKFLHGIGNIGFALCRLEAMTDFPLPGLGGSSRREAYATHHTFQMDWPLDDGKGIRSVGVKAFVPDWWPRNTNQPSSTS
jgi:folate-binding protein YgfZ